MAVQQTLLDMVQTILSSLNSDEVNSISDSTEAMQIARIIQGKYYDIIARGRLPAQETLIQLVASTSAVTPVTMTVPEGVVRIDWIKYFDSDPGDVADPVPGYKYVTILALDVFLDMTNRFSPNDTNVDSFTFTDTGGANFTFYFKDDQQPKYCTIIGNQYVIFDAYNQDFDDTLQTSKILAFGTKYSPFLLQDTFIPPIDEHQFPLLLNEAKALAFYELKQIPHPQATQEIKRQWTSLQKDKTVNDKPSNFDQLPSFGRVPRTGGWTSGGYGAYRWMRSTGP